MIKYIKVGVVKMSEKDERRKVLVKEMYEIIASSSAELGRLEEIIYELIPLSNE